MMCNQNWMTSKNRQKVRGGKTPRPKKCSHFPNLPPRSDDSSGQKDTLKELGIWQSPAASFQTKVPILAPIMSLFRLKSRFLKWEARSWVFFCNTCYPLIIASSLSRNCFISLKLREFNNQHFQFQELKPAFAE